MSKSVNKLPRKFYYYTYSIEYFNSETNTNCIYNNLTEKVLDIFYKIKELPYDDKNFDKNFCIFKNRNEDYFYMFIDSIDKEYIQFRLLICRDKLLPFIEKDGKVTPLSSVLKNSQKLAEVTHCILFPKYGILGMEYNYSGAKAKDLTAYILNKFESQEVLNFPIVNLINMDSLKKLHSSKEMSLLNIKVISNSKVIEELIKEDTAFEALDCKKNNIDQVELCFRTRTSKKRKGFKFPCINPEFVGRLFTNYKQDFDKFKVKYGYGMEEVDVLSENFVCSSKFIPIESTKTIDKSDAYDTIKEYFENHVKIYVDK